MEYLVDSCPQNITAVLESSTRLGCGQDKYGNDQYICVPNTDKTSLIELCYNGIMGMKERGHCLEISGGKLYQIDCLGFSSGCPETDFRSNKIYEYPACQSINTQHNCYLAERSCPNTTVDITARDTTKVSTLGLSTNPSVFNTTTINLQESTLPQDEQTYTMVVVGSLIAVLFIIVLLVLAIILWKINCRKKKKEEVTSTEGDKFLPENRIETSELGNALEQDNIPLQCLGENEFSAAIPRYGHHSPSTKDNNVEATVKESGMDDINTQEENENEDEAEAHARDTGAVPEFERSQLSTNDGTLEKQETGVNSDPKEREYGVTEVTEAGSNDNSSETESESTRITSNDSDDDFLGDYELWKTKLSDEFSTLTDHEVSVLFCFLCSDSGPPDFTDTEWLDMLNEIRLYVYHKEDPVTSEEAQQTLDRLKSRDFLWEDQDKIKEDIKDETIYKITSIDSRIPFLYSSYDTASVYLRLNRYSRKPGEKCIISSYNICDSLLIRRLQMNILTHVTMEDRDIYDEIYQILNVPKNILKDSKDKREEFLMDLRKGGEAVHYRGRSQDSVHHVTWLWRYRSQARPDIVRSCIGLHPHWDIYIIDNKAYSKPIKKKRSLKGSQLCKPKRGPVVCWQPAYMYHVLKEIRT